MKPKSLFDARPFRLNIFAITGLEEMASTSAEDAPTAITRKRFCYLPDAAVGKRVDEIIDDEYRFKTVGGLDF
jgi:hypothetical protein